MKTIIHKKQSLSQLRVHTCVSPPLSASQTSPHLMGSDPLHKGAFDTRSFCDDFYLIFIYRQSLYRTLPLWRGFLYTTKRSAKDRRAYNIFKKFQNPSLIGKLLAQSFS